MNAEELKMILDAVSAVSGDAKSVLFWYFVGKYGVDLMSHLLIAATIVSVSWFVQKTLREMSEHSSVYRDVCSYLDLSRHYTSSSDIIKAIEAKAKGASNG